jgi:hypothetical protein
MKRLCHLLLSLMLLTTVSSCTREFVCQCEVKYSGTEPGLPEVSYNEYIVKDSKESAAKKCAANSTVVTTNGVTLTETCKLY